MWLMWVGGGDGQPIKQRKQQRLLYEYQRCSASEYRLSSVMCEGWQDVASIRLSGFLMMMMVVVDLSIIFAYYF